MKSLMTGILVLAFAASAFAGEKHMACLERTEEALKVYHHVTYLFHKVTITRQTSGRLRGNYAYSPKGQMNYGSIDVAFEPSEAKWESTGPSKTIREFRLIVSNEAVEQDVLVAHGTDGSYREAGKLAGFRSSLRVVEAIDGEEIVRETRNLICNPNERKLFIKN